MKSHDNTSENGRGSTHRALVPLVVMEDINRLRIPLTLVHGHVQLLQRRLRRGQSLSDDDLLKALDTVTDASHKLKAQLEEIYQNAESQAKWSDPA